jgi:hypothetical protein
MGACGPVEGLSDGARDGSELVDSVGVERTAEDARDEDLGARDAGREGDGSARADAEVPYTDAQGLDGTVRLAPSVYPADRTHSPIDESVQRRLRAIAAQGTGSERSFSKVGDSQTVVESGFMTCFAGASVDLGGRDALRGTLENFRAVRIEGATPYERRSLAAVVGWSAGAAITGSPSPLEQELAASNPLYAVVMFGSNDSQARDLPRYGEALWQLTDRAIARGVIPLLTSPPPRGDSALADAWIPRYAHVARAVAQARQVPFVDLERQLRVIPGFGLGGDNLHLSRSPRGACHLSDAELRYGQNQRNLRTLEALDRVRRALPPDAAPPDPDPSPVPSRRPAGTVADPVVIRALPFADLRDTAREGSMLFGRYGCASADEGGREVVYRLDLPSAATVRAMVLDLGDVDVDLHRLSALDPAACVARDDRQLLAALSAGSHFFIVDSFVPSDRRAREGEFVLVVLRE